MGQRGVLRVLEYFGKPERVYFAQQEDLEMIPGLAPQAIRGLLDKNMEESKAILGRCDRLGVQIMTIQDADYPERLRQLSDPPAVLYILGRRIRFDEEAAIGVVGSRKPSAYGQQVAPRLGLELARCGALLVSGIAQGIDSLAPAGRPEGRRQRGIRAGRRRGCALSQRKSLPLSGCGGGGSPDQRVSAGDTPPG